MGRRHGRSARRGGRGGGAGRGRGRGHRGGARRGLGIAAGRARGASGEEGAGGGGGHTSTRGARGGAGAGGGARRGGARSSKAIQVDGGVAAAATAAVATAQPSTPADADVDSSSEARADYTVTGTGGYLVEGSETMEPWRRKGLGAGLGLALRETAAAECSGDLNVAAYRYALPRDTGDGLDESDSVNYLQRHAMVVDVEECDISSESSEERECAKFTSSSLFEGLLELHKQGLLPKEPKHFLSTSEVEIGDIFTLELPAGVQKPLLSILPQGSFIRAQCHNNIGSYPTGSVLLSGPCTIIITSKFYWPENERNLLHFWVKRGEQFQLFAKQLKSLKQLVIVFLFNGADIAPSDFHSPGINTDFWASIAAYAVFCETHNISKMRSTLKLKHVRKMLNKRVQTDALIEKLTVLAKSSHRLSSCCTRMLKKGDKSADALIDKTKETEEKFREKWKELKRLNASYTAFDRAEYPNCDLGSLLDLEEDRVAPIFISSATSVPSCSSSASDGSELPPLEPPTPHVPPSTSPSDSSVPSLETLDEPNTACES